MVNLVPHMWYTVNCLFDIYENFIVCYIFFWQFWNPFLLTTTAISHCVRRDKENLSLTHWEAEVYWISIYVYIRLWPMGRPIYTKFSLFLTEFEILCFNIFVTIFDNFQIPFNKKNITFYYFFYFFKKNHAKKGEVILLVWAI